MNCVILQPSYIPWRGFFHQIEKADVFVFYDDVQYDKNGWRNRNKIKTSNDSAWLTVPVRNLGLATPINEVPIDWRQNWAKKHSDTIRQCYSKAPYYKQYSDLVHSFFDRRDELLVDFTIDTTMELAHALGIENTKFVRSSSILATAFKTDRLIAVLQKLKATHYISGPSAKSYIETEKFDAAGISLEYMSYDYPEYPQLNPPYNPFVSILDLLFCVGPNAGKHIWG